MVFQEKKFNSYTGTFSKIGLQISSQSKNTWGSVNVKTRCIHNIYTWFPWFTDQFNTSRNYGTSFAIPYVSVRYRTYSVFKGWREWVCIYLD